MFGIDSSQATKRAKYGIEYYGIGYNTGKISNAAGIKSGKYYENVYKDMEVILKNAQTVSDLITDTYKGFNEWFTDKYSKLIGTDDCMIDGDDFRAALALWKTSPLCSTTRRIFKYSGICKGKPLFLQRRRRNRKICKSIKSGKKMGRF